MKMYLRKIDEPQYYSDAADYVGDEPPFPAKEGWEWAQGEPEEGSIPYVEKSIAQNLDEIFMALPLEIRSVFYPDKAAIKAAIDSNDLEAVQYIISSRNVPDTLPPEIKQKAEFARGEMLKSLHSDSQKEQSHGS